MFSKKLTSFIVAFVLVAVVSVFLFFKGKPKVTNKNPLNSIAAESVTKIKISNDTGDFTLEKKADRWEITEPFNDWTEPPVMDPLVDDLLFFTIGSIVSESEARYPKFHIEDGKARRFQVFVEGRERPTLDGYFGKQAMVYQTAYFRFAGQVPVYLTEGIAVFIIVQGAQAYRLKDGLPVNVEKISQIEVKGPVKLAVSRVSSETWKNDANGKEIEKAKTDELIKKIRGLRSYEFGTDEQLKEQDFSKSKFIVRVKDDKQTHVLRIGDAVPVEKEKSPPKKFAQTEGRPALLIIQDTHIDGFLAAVKNL